MTIRKTMTTVIRVNREHEAWMETCLETAEALMKGNKREDWMMVVVWLRGVAAEICKKERRG